MDQYESAVQGRIHLSRGQESFRQKFGGSTLFCDHASGYVQVHHQVSLRASDTIRSKQKFERDIRSCGVTVDEYHGDNSIFLAKEVERNFRNTDSQLTSAELGHNTKMVSRNVISIL
jgi:hypothetical protein